MSFRHLISNYVLYSWDILCIWKYINICMYLHLTFVYRIHCFTCFAYFIYILEVFLYQYIDSYFPFFLFFFLQPHSVPLFRYSVRRFRSPLLMDFGVIFSLYYCRWCCDTHRTLYICHCRHMQFTCDVSPCTSRCWVRGHRHLWFW